MPGFWDAYQRSKEATTGILARHYVGGALQRGDIAGAAQQAYRLGMYGEGQTLQAQAQAQAQQAARANAGAQLAQGQGQQGANALLGTGDFEGANVIQQFVSQATAQQLAAEQRRTGAVGQLALGLQDIPYDRRRDAIAAAMPQLLAAGVKPEEIEAFDPTDDNLRVRVNSAMTFDQALKQREGYTLSQGQTRYNGRNEAVASVAPKPEYISVAPGGQAVLVNGPGGPAPVASVPGGSPAPGAPASPASPGASIQLRPPVPGATSSDFGPRTPPRTNAGRGSANHGGVDYPVPVGTPVAAAAEGVVVAAGPVGGYGNQIRVRHPDGTETTYSHLSRIGVKPGDPVQAGAPIGASGATGNVSGPNLHFEVIENGRPVNPTSRFGQPARAGQPQPQARPQGGAPAVIQGPPRETYTFLTESEKRAQGLDPTLQYQRSPTGQITPVGGQARGSVRPIPAGPMQRHIDLGQSAKKLNDALVALQRYPQGVGFVIGNMPPDIQQRIDQDGVDVRAAIGDIGSLIIHERSGAAVTVSESPRFRPFVPLITDTPETAKKKLVKLLGMIADEQAAMESEYSQEQGFRGFAGTNAPQGQPRPAQRPAYTPQQQSALPRFRGTTAQRGTPGNPFVPTTQAQYDALPVGASYLTPEGQIATKKANR